MGFSLNTREVAKLARTDPTELYTACYRAGQWRGITPRKIHNGRLLWPAEEVCDALGVVASDAPQSHRLVAEFMEREAVPVCPETLALGRALLRHEAGVNDPSYMPAESFLIIELVHAWVSRVFNSLPSMDERDRGFVLRAANRIASLATEVSQND